MKTPFLSIVLFFILSWANAQPGSISNIQVTQGTGEYQRVMDIVFDLTGNDPIYIISLEISFDNGASYDPIDPGEVSGSLTVSPGMGIHLVWDGRLSYPDLTSDVSRLRIIATTWQCGNPITDSRDGQIYNTVLIGSQCWMAENLNVGIRVSPYGQSNNGIIEKLCYGEIPANCDEYGGLYEWGEMMNYTTGETNQGICPTGWHIPTLNEWETLIGFLGGPSTAGGKLKETGFNHWNEPNTGASNESGFTALGSGKWEDGYNSMDQAGLFWTNFFNGEDQFLKYVQFNSAAIGSGYSYYEYRNCLSVRCIKNQ
jgi:uncharacterized protein (TIGR02145 family)